MEAWQVESETLIQWRSPPQILVTAESSKVRDLAYFGAALLVQMSVKEAVIGLGRRRLFCQDVAF